MKFCHCPFCYQKNPNKFIKPKKKQTSLFKIRDEEESPEEITDEELRELKKLYFSKGKHLLFPEFSVGCPECGDEIFHYFWCSHFNHI